VDAIVKAAFGIRGRLRMPRDARFRALIPAWVPDMLVLDTIQTQFDRFRSREELVAYLRSVGIDPVFYLDSPSTGTTQLPDSAQTAAAIDGFPNNVQWAIYPEGAFIGVDSGATIALNSQVSQNTTGTTNTGLTKVGAGRLEFQGPLPNTYFGTTTINDGTLRLNKRAGATSGLNFLIGDNFGPAGSDVLEIGSIAFLPSGLGVLYVARTATETAVFSQPLFPTASTPQGVRVVGPVRFEEPISIGSQGPDLFFITPSESLAVVPIRDRNQDGSVDSVGAVLGLLRNRYSPGVSNTYEVAYSYTRSEDPTSVPLVYGHYENGVMSDPLSGSPTPGKFPSWKPGESMIAYQNGDAIMFSIVSPFSTPGGDTLYAQGVNTAPSWGKWGAKTVAFLHGSVPGSYTDLMITASNAPEAVTLLRDLVDPRFIAWSPLEELLAITEHPGGTPAILVVTSLPLP